MTRPAIIVVDDDPQVLAAVSRDLRARYAEDHRIVVAGSGGEAVEILEQIQARGESVALFLVDQRMPGMSGTEYLIEARRVFPEAKRALLTAYADTEAAIQAINEVDLDHYLLKPWDPPEDRLYPVVDELLEDWTANVRAPFDGVRVMGTTWSPSTHDVKDFLARNQIPYRFVDVERDAEARGRVEAAWAAADRDDRPLPVVFLPEGEALIDPGRRAIAERVGLHTEAAEPFYDLVIVGGGPAGLAAAVYGGSEGLRVALIEKEATGGQAGTSSRIENYLGFPSGISGGNLARRATDQAKRLGAEIITPVEVASVRSEDQVKIVEMGDGTQLRGHTVVVASGMRLRRYERPGFERFTGAGVYYGAAISEAATYRGQDVYIVGGANSAGQAAMMFSRFASTVTIVSRAESLERGMSQYLIDQIRAQDNIAVRLHTSITEATGSDRMEQIVLRDLGSGEDESRPAGGVFIFIGAVPHSDFVAGLVERDERGFIVTGPDLFHDGRPPPAWPLERDPYLLETSVPGIFAAGDVRHGSVRRVASAVGQGSVVVSFVHRYLESV